MPAMAGDDWLPLTDGFVWPASPKNAPVFKSELIAFKSLTKRSKKAVRASWPDDDMPERVEISEVDLNGDKKSEFFIGVPAYSGSGGTGWVLVTETVEGFRGIGSLLGFGIQFLPKINGWYQIEGRSKGGGGHHTRYLLSFDGTEYFISRIENHDLIDGEIKIRKPNKAEPQVAAPDGQ